jgi:hypothetical protein
MLADFLELVDFLLPIFLQKPRMKACGKKASLRNFKTWLQRINPVFAGYLMRMEIKMMQL